MSARDAQTITIELDTDTDRRLEALVIRTGEKKADLLRNAVRNGIEDLEEYFSAAETLERLRNGTERTHSAEEVRRELGLGR